LFINYHYATAVLIQNIILITACPVNIFIMGTSDLEAYLILLLVASAAADVGEDYDYPYTDFFPELSVQPSGLDTTDTDFEEMHELRSLDCKAVPKMATVRDDLGLLFRSTQPPRQPPIIPRINTSGADRGLRQTQHASDFDSTYLFNFLMCT